MSLTIPPPLSDNREPPRKAAAQPNPALRTPNGPLDPDQVFAVIAARWKVACGEDCGKEWNVEAVRTFFETCLPESVRLSIKGSAEELGVDFEVLATWLEARPWAAPAPVVIEVEKRVVVTDAEAEAVRERLQGLADSLGIPMDELMQQIERAAAPQDGFVEERVPVTTREPAKPQPQVQQKAGTRIQDS